MRLLLVGLFAMLTSNALAADYRPTRDSSRDPEVVVEDIVTYQGVTLTKAHCMTCRGASIPWGGLRRTYKAHLPWDGLRKPAVAELPWSGLPDYCPPVRPLRRVVITTKG